jgi:hypothetical protein
MTRSLYRGLVRLHPRAFRSEFGDEMLWIFDEASASGASSLITDGLISLFRQWLLRTRVWTLAAALAGGMLQVSLGGAVMLLHGRSNLHRATVWTSDVPAAEELLHVTVWALAAVLAMVAALALWVKSLNSRRLQQLAAGFARR